MASPLVTLSRFVANTPIGTNCTIVTDPGVTQLYTDSALLALMAFMICRLSVAFMGAGSLLIAMALLRWLDPAFCFMTGFRNTVSIRVRNPSQRLPLLLMNCLGYGGIPMLLVDILTMHINLIIIFYGPRYIIVEAHPPIYLMAFALLLVAYLQLAFTTVRYLDNTTKRWAGLGYFVETDGVINHWALRLLELSNRTGIWEKDTWTPTHDRVVIDAPQTSEKTKVG